MHVTLIAAQSVDGFITKHDEPGAGFTSEADKRFFRAALKEFDCCVMGSKSYEQARNTIQRHLPRVRIVLTRRPNDYASEASAGTLEFTSSPAQRVLEDLERRGCKRCALVGGGEIHGLFFEQGLVDELWLTVEPLLFGRGTPLCGRMVESRLELTSNERLEGSTLLLKYRVARQ